MHNLHEINQTNACSELYAMPAWRISMSVKSMFEDELCISYLCTCMHAWSALTGPFQRRPAAYAACVILSVRKTVT